jgi:hypothetical protein
MLERIIVGWQVLGVVSRSVLAAYQPLLSRWLHEVNLALDLCNRAGQQDASRGAEIRSQARECPVFGSHTLTNEVSLLYVRHTYAVSCPGAAWSCVQTN